MKTIDVLRHTMRSKPGQHLSQAGIDLAREVGKRLGPYDLVVASPLPRAIETALVMGYAVTDFVEEISDMPEDVGAAIGWPAAFAHIAAVLARGGAPAKFARMQARAWEAIAEKLAEDGRALVISHGGIIEMGAVALFGEPGPQCWGEALAYCEGVRLTFDGDRLTELAVLRLPETQRLVSN